MNLKKSYTYYIVYMGLKPEATITTYGNEERTLDKEIDSMDDIVAIQTKLNEEYGFADCVIMFYKLLRTSYNTVQNNPSGMADMMSAMAGMMGSGLPQTATEIPTEAEVKDGKNVETEEDNIINNVEPLWTKAPSTLKDEDYKNFYRTLYPMSDEPLFWIHLNVDFPFGCQSLVE